MPTKDPLKPHVHRKDAHAKDAPRGDDGRAAGILELVRAVMHQMRSKQLRDPAFVAAGLSPSEGRALAFFARHPGATQSDLVAHSGRDKGQVARLLAGLRERELLAAEADAGDRRVIRLTLSPAAEALHEAVRRQRRKLAEAAVAGLDASERQALQALLERVLANLDQID